jgi:hypothetical protein
MSIKVIFSNDSICNTTASCDSLGIYYEITKTALLGGTRRIEKWDRESNENILVSEIKMPAFSQNTVKFAGDEDWKPMTHFLWKAPTSSSASTCVHFLPPDSASWFTFCLWFLRSKVFRGNNGVEYKWKIKGNKLEVCYRIICTLQASSHLSSFEGILRVQRR